MNREITKELINWKHRANRKPLVVRGARQVGKTYVIDQFANLNFNRFVKINFEEQIELKALFKTQKTDQILNELSILYKTDIIPGETLIFLDEIQACPEAIVTLRYFFEKHPDLHIIAAGSLLDFALNEMRYSMPVGRIEFCYMYPLSFKEFILALSEDRILEYLENYSLDAEFSPVIHNKILELLRLYMFIGGMPEAVQTYIIEKQFSQVERVHSSILTTLQYDFAKYGNRNQQEYLVSVLKYAAQHIGKKVKYANIDRDVRSSYLKESFQKLELARLVRGVRHTSASQIPLASYVNENVYKPLFMDIGLANHLSGIRLVELEKILTSYEGALAEQFVGQELLTIGPPYMNPTLYYWTREEKNSNAEIDYIYQHNNSIYPIEVKAGKTGALKSLQVYLFEKKLTIGIRFNLDLPNIGRFKTKVRARNEEGEIEFTLISLPLYLCFRLPALLASVV